MNINLDGITDGWWDWDIIGHTLYLSPLLKKNLGYKEHELANCMDSYEALMLADGKQPLQQSLQECITQNNDGSIIQEMRCQHKAGHVIWIMLHTKGILDSQGKLIRIVAALNDITALKNSSAALEKLAYLDFLTQIPNKSAFLDSLTHAIERSKRMQVSLAIMYLDIDNFKTCNDQFGHEFGDALLCAVAKKLTHTSRTVDFIARLAGDEFGILLENITQQTNILDVATRYLHAFHETLFIKNKPMQLTVSIGVALYPLHGQTEQALLKQADQAMYLAKQQGKNQVVLA